MPSHSFNCFLQTHKLYKCHIFFCDPSRPLRVSFPETISALPVVSIAQGVEQSLNLFLQYNIQIHSMHFCAEMLISLFAELSLHSLGDNIHDTKQAIISFRSWREKLHLNLAKSAYRSMGDEIL